MRAIGSGATAIAILASITAAQASSGDAWTEFRKAVETACVGAAAGLDGIEAIVDPFGSESFGLALLKGRPKGGDQPVMMICVYDKRTHEVELGGEIEVPPQ